MKVVPVLPLGILQACLRLQRSSQVSLLLLPCSLPHHEVSQLLACLQVRQQAQAKSVPSDNTNILGSCELHAAPLKVFFLKFEKNFKKCLSRNYILCFFYFRPHRAFDFGPACCR